MSKYKFSRKEAAFRLTAAVESLARVETAAADEYTEGLLAGYQDALTVARDFILEEK